MPVMTLTDGDGFTWDFVDSYSLGSTIINGTGDAFDGGLQLSVNGTIFNGSFGSSELDGRQLVVNGSVGGVEVERRLYVPDTPGDGWARLLESFTNTSTVPVTITVAIRSNSGNDGSMVVTGTSSGDTVFTTADQWVANDEYFGAGGDPAVAHILTDGTLAPTSVTNTVFNAYGNLGVGYTFTLTIEPGETVSLLHYVTQQHDMTGINSEVPTLVDPDEAALFGLTADQLDSIANFDISAPITHVIDTLSDVDLTDTNHDIQYLGDSAYGYYYQTFTAVDGSLETISFAIDPIQLSGTTDFTVVIMSINENGAFGSVLFESDLITVSGDNDGQYWEPSDYEVLTVNTGGLALTAGQYVVVFNANAGGTDGGNSIQFALANTNDPAESLGYYHWIDSGTVEGDLAGRPVWDAWSGDIALRLEFSNGMPADTTPPAAPTLDLDAVADSGVSDSDDLTNDSTPSISGAAEAGSTVTVYDGATEVGTATADGDGNWSLTLAAALTDGAHTLTATATDEAGNVSDASSGLTVTIDTATPDPTIASTSSELDTTPVLAGTAEAGASVAIHDADGNLVATVTADGDGNWSHELAALMDGDYAYSATATDVAGNVSTAVSTTVSVVVPGITVPGANGGAEIDGTDGLDDLSGGNGTDTLDGGWAPDMLNGGNGADTLLGGAGDDSLYGGNGADVMDGGDGDDLMVGGRGDDLMTGGDGADLFVIGQSGGNDTILDFEVGEDSLQLNDDLTVASLAISGDDTLVYLSNGSQLTLANVNIVSVDNLLGA